MYLQHAKENIISTCIQPRCQIPVRKEENWEVTQWESTCCTRVRTWVWSPHAKLDTVACVCNPSTLRQDRRSLEAPRPAGLAHAIANRRPYLKGEGQDFEIVLWPPPAQWHARAYTPAHKCAHKLKNRLWESLRPSNTNPPCMLSLVDVEDAPDKNENVIWERGRHGMSRAGAPVRKRQSHFHEAAGGRPQDGTCATRCRE